MAIIQENFRNASEFVEVVSLKDGNITVFIKDDEAIIFESLLDFFNYQNGNAHIQRIYCEQGDLSEIYDNATSFYTIDKKHEVIFSDEN